MIEHGMILVGHVRRRDGHLVKIHYFFGDNPPYGDIRANLIR